MADILNQIMLAKKREISALYQTHSLSWFKEKLSQNPLLDSLFYKHLSQPGLSLIAEIKKASPSKGIIRQDFKVTDIYDSFIHSGAAAISVLTEKPHFQGNIDYLSQLYTRGATPLLRKDFIIDPIQVYEAKYYGASAILLIKALLSQKTAQLLIDLAHELKLDVLMEIHNKCEANDILALKNLTIIGINNRNLSSFKVDTQTAIQIKKKLINKLPKETLFIAESGYQNSSDLAELESNHFDAVLIGEGLAKNPKLLSYFKHQSN